jgi:hypothetical protein
VRHSDEEAVGSEAMKHEGSGVSSLFGIVALNYAPVKHWGSGTDFESTL